MFTFHEGRGFSHAKTHGNPLGFGPRVIIMMISVAVRHKSNFHLWKSKSQIIFPKKGFFEAEKKQMHISYTVSKFHLNSWCVQFCFFASTFQIYPNIYKPLCFYGRLQHPSSIMTVQPRLSEVDFVTAVP